MKNKEIVSAEVAEEEFERFIDCNDLLVDQTDEGFKLQKQRIVRAIQHGHLTVDDDGQAVYVPHRPASGFKEALTFRERTGADLMSMKGGKNSPVKEMYLVLGSMTGQPPSTFSRLAGEDIKVCEALFALLMA